MSEYFDQLKAFFHYLFKHIFEIEFVIRILFELLLCFLIIWTLLKLFKWLAKKASKVFFYIYNFFVYEAIFPILIRISDKFAYNMGGPKWQDRANKLREIANNHGTLKESKEELKPETKKKSFKKFYIGSYIFLVAYLLCFHYLLQDVQAGYSIFFVPEKLIYSCESFLTNTFFSTNENNIACFFTFLHSNEQTLPLIEPIKNTTEKSIEKTTERIIENSDTIITLTTKPTLLPEYPYKDKVILTISFNITPFSSTIDFNGKVLPFIDGSCYDFKYDGENTRLIRVLDFIYFYCEHSIRIFPMQNGIQLVFNKDKWTVPKNAVTIEYPDGISDLPYHVVPFIYEGSSPEIYVDKWYKVTADRNFVLVNDKGEETLKLFISNNKVNIKTKTANETISRSSETALFCFKNGILLKYPDSVVKK